MTHDRYPDRLEMINSCIIPNSKVLDLGCGDGYLKSILPDGCTYVGVDNVNGNADLSCNFNLGEFPPLEKYEFVVASGLLEYIHNLGVFLSNIKKYGGTFIVSFNCFDGLLSRFVFKKKEWVNNLTYSEIINIFNYASLFLNERIPYRYTTFLTEYIFVFKKQREKDDS
jgi:SAM-dependent methyltransferase